MKVLVMKVGVWIDSHNKQAIIISGKKSLGSKHYGYADGTDYGRVIADYPETYDPTVAGHQKGIFENNFKGVFLFFNPEDIAKVVEGTLKPHEVQPYASFYPDKYAFDIHRKHDSIKWGGMAFDQENGILYVIEKNGK